MNPRLHHRFKACWGLHPQTPGCIPTLVLAMLHPNINVGCATSQYQCWLCCIPMVMLAVLHPNISVGCTTFQYLSFNNHLHVPVSADHFFIYLILFFIFTKYYTIKYQSIITSGYTIFSVTGLSILLSHIALILCTEVTQETATYNCPCVNTAFLRSNPT